MMSPPAGPRRSSTRLCFMLNLASSAPLKFPLVENILESGRAATFSYSRLCVIEAPDNDVLCINQEKRNSGSALKNEGF
jgi:hypothetical protein